MHQELRLYLHELFFSDLSHPKISCGAILPEVSLRKIVMLVTLPTFLVESLKKEKTLVDLRDMWFPEYYRCGEKGVASGVSDMLYNFVPRVYWDTRNN